MLIGWDAADWQFIKPLLDKGLMPNLAEFVEHGVMGNVTTLRPVLSPILWNSIATGKRADKHDILGFTEPDGSGSIRPVTSTSRKAKALWNILSQNGIKSAVVSWFASHPAEQINGMIVSDRFPKVADRDGKIAPVDPKSIHPQSLYDVMSALRVSIDDITPAQLLPFIPNAAKVNQQQDHRMWQLAEALADCASVHNAATYAAENEPWDFLAVYYNLIDHLGHGFMKFHPPRQDHVRESDFELYSEVMTACYRFHDMMLGRLMNLAGPETTTILLSDHGFQSGSARPGRITGPIPEGHLHPEDQPLAWHRSHGVFAIHGPLVKRDEMAHGISLLDIAPTVLYALGLPVGKDMDGKPQTRLFTEVHEPTYIDSYEPAHPRDGVWRETVADDPFAAHEALRQLADLGYIEPLGGDSAKAIERVVQDRKSNLAQVYLDAGRIEESLAVAIEMLNTHPNAMTRARIAMCLMALRRIDEAEPYLLQAMAEQPDFALAQMLYGQILALKGESDAALQHFERVRGSTPRFAEIHGHIGRLHLRARRWHEAESSFRKAVEIDEDSADAHNGLGMALSRLGHFDEALNELMRSASLEHNSPRTHINLGDLLVKLSQIEWAIRAYTVAAELVPNWPLPHRKLAQIYRHLKKDDDARRHHMIQARLLRRKRDAQILDALKK